MATRSRTTPADGNKPAPLFTVLVGYETLHGRICELESGTVLAPASLLPWLGAAYFERAIFSLGTRVDVSVRARSSAAGPARRSRCATGGAPTRIATSRRRTARATTSSPTPKAARPPGREEPRQQSGTKPPRTRRPADPDRRPRPRGATERTTKHARTPACRARPPEKRSAGRGEEGGGGVWRGGGRRALRGRPERIRHHGDTSIRAVFGTCQRSVDLLPLIKEPLISIRIAISQMHGVGVHRVSTDISCKLRGPVILIPARALRTVQIPCNGTRVEEGRCRLKNNRRQRHRASPHGGTFEIRGCRPGADPPCVC